MAVHAICVLALLLLGFGHKMPLLAATAAPSIASAVPRLPDGSLPDLCITVHESEQATTLSAGQGADKTRQDSRHLKAQDCEACRLQASVMLPAPAVSDGLFAGAASPAVFPALAQTLHARHFSPNRTSRGPPLPAV
ncbi:DUF2946 family protein [Allorhizobium undicola]|uniref:DUF2946 family protein n=1 Tax=Allorhizobium undicola TaxID=78527 RepID=UPI003D348C40